jgi:DNA-directed RNA polymerase specialized sigma24 family protein
LDYLGREIVNPEALSGLYDRHAAAVYQLGLLAGLRRAQAERLVITTFYTAWKTPRGYDGRLSERDWLLAIALGAIGRRSNPLFHWRRSKRSIPALRLAHVQITGG